MDCEVNQSGGQILVRARLYPAWHESFAQPVTMDTRPWCGVVLSDSAETGYELGIRTVAVVWRLGCLTVECPARRYPGCLP